MRVATRLKQILCYQRYVGDPTWTPFKTRVRTDTFCRTVFREFCEDDHNFSFQTVAQGAACFLYAFHICLYENLTADEAVGEIARIYDPATMPFSQMHAFLFERLVLFYNEAQ